MMAATSRYSPVLVHLLASAVALGVVFLVARFAWYPGAYFGIAGVAETLLVLSLIALLLGPLLTHLACRRNVPGDMFGLSVMGVVQIVALMWGSWTLATQRPAFMVFEDGAFQVTRRDAGQEPLPDTHHGASALPVVAAGLPGAPGEAGRYRPLADAAEVLATSGLPVHALMHRDARVRREVRQLVPEGGAVSGAWRIYPAFGHRDGWSVVVDVDSVTVVGIVRAHSRWIRAGGERRAAPPPPEVVEARPEPAPSRAGPGAGNRG